jgi:hypothetical protein
MTGQEYLQSDKLQEFAPTSSILAFRPFDTGSPMQDWCAHLQQNPRFRRELEEFAVLGDVVVRIADGSEPEPLEKVKILSLAYAVKFFGNEEDAREFVRSVRAIASPDAGEYELEQIAAFYYKEIRRRKNTAQVLKEMGLLGIEMEAVTATVKTREIDFTETETAPEKLSVADQRNLQKIQGNLAPLPARTPNFDAELAMIFKKMSGRKISDLRRDDYADYYLSDEGKSLEDLDRDFQTFEALEQYDENGIIGFNMSGGQRSIVVYDFETEVDISYLPDDLQPLAREMNLLFVGHRIGGAAARCARRFTLAYRIDESEMKAVKNTLTIAQPAAKIPPAENFSDLPFSDGEFNEWLAAKLEVLYPHRTLRTVRRLVTNGAGITVEVPGKIEVNPDRDEMNYAAAVCRILWNQKKRDFHLKALRRREYQEFYLDIRKTVDTADVARLKKQAFGSFKEKNTLSLKEFTSLNTVAKSQEARLAGHVTHGTRKLLGEIKRATLKRIRYLKYFLYNDTEIKRLARQEKQILWEAVKARETEVKQTVSPVRQPSLFANQMSQETLVRVTRQTI